MIGYVDIFDMSSPFELKGWGVSFYRGPGGSHSIVGHGGTGVWHERYFYVCIMV